MGVIILLVAMAQQEKQQQEVHEDVLALFSNNDTDEKLNGQKAEAATHAMSSALQHELYSLLDEFDNEGTGTFDVSELPNIAVAVGEPLSKDECALILQDLDSEGTGVVSFVSFIKWWNSENH